MVPVKKKREMLRKCRPRLVLALTLGVTLLKLRFFFLLKYRSRLTERQLLLCVAAGLSTVYPHRHKELATLCYYLLFPWLLLCGFPSNLIKEQSPSQLVKERQSAYRFLRRNV